MRNLFSKLFGAKNGANPEADHAQPSQDQGGEKAARRAVVVVSGLPRSGTSMMMKMLEAGGLQVMADHLRSADTDNPEGYYEFERVKALDKGDTAWVVDAQGKVVKVISALLEHLPPGYQYKVIFMHREIQEVLASQRKMLQHRSQEGAIESEAAIRDEEMAQLFAKHLETVNNWLRAQPHIGVLDVNYNQLLRDPKPHIQAINRFLGAILDEAEMAEVVNPTLYRNRAR
jgi:hypothetical protein